MTNGSPDYREMQKHLKFLNSSDPFLMILMTHAHVESTLLAVCSRILPADVTRGLKNAGFSRLVSTARILGLVSVEEQVALRKLASLRNRLAHGWKVEPTVTVEDIDNLYSALKIKPLPSGPEAEEMLRDPHMRLSMVLGLIGSNMREKERRLEELLPEVRKHRERLSLLHFNPGEIRHLSKEDWDLFTRTGPEEGEEPEC